MIETDKEIKSWGINKLIFYDYLLNISINIKH